MTKRERRWWRRQKETKRDSRKLFEFLFGEDTGEQLDWPVDDDDQSWMCNCGHWQTDGFHCFKCGAEPPWGCDCSLCQDKAWDEEDVSDYDFWVDPQDLPPAPTLPPSNERTDDLPF